MITLDHLDVRFSISNGANAGGVMELAQQLSVARMNTVGAAQTTRKPPVFRRFRARVSTSRRSGVCACLPRNWNYRGSSITSLPAWPRHTGSTSGACDPAAKTCWCGAARTHDGLQDLIQKVVSIHGVAHSNTTLALADFAAGFGYNRSSTNLRR